MKGLQKHAMVIVTIVYGRGTGRYRAAELHLEGYKVTKRADAWATGLIVCELGTGKRAFVKDLQVVDYTCHNRSWIFQCHPYQTNSYGI